MNYQPPIRVDKGNFVSALFLSVGRDFRDLMRNPLAFVGGVLGLSLTSVALWFGGEAMAKGADANCEALAADVNNSQIRVDEIATKLSDLDTKVGALQERLTSIADEIEAAKAASAPTAPIETERASVQKELAALEAQRPAIVTELDQARLDVEERQAKLLGEGCEDEDEFEIDFQPGTIARLGEKIDPEDMPQKIVVQETRAPDPVEEPPTQETVTTDEKAKPSDEPKEKKDDTKDKSDFKDNKDKKLPTSKKPTTSNTPFKNDLPTVDHNIGDPFGDPEGWDDLTRDGDPWATSVMKALNNMPIGAYAAKAKSGEMKFQLSICKDGTIKQVLKKGGSLPADGQAAVMLALEQLEIPKPPKKVADSMPSSCAKIKYTFVWSSKGVK